MKAPVKMIVPTGIFIFRTVFIVLIGPAVLTVAKAFGSWPQPRPVARRVWRNGAFMMACSGEPACAAVGFRWLLRSRRTGG